MHLPTEIIHSIVKEHAIVKSYRDIHDMKVRLQFQHILYTSAHVDRHWNEAITPLLYRHPTLATPSAIELLYRTTSSSSKLSEFVESLRIPSIHQKWFVGLQPNLSKIQDLPASFRGIFAACPNLQQVHMYFGRKSYKKKVMSGKHSGVLLLKTPFPVDQISAVVTLQIGHLKIHDTIPVLALPSLRGITLYNCEIHIDDVFGPCVNDPSKEYANHSSPEIVYLALNAVEFSSTVDVGKFFFCVSQNLPHLLELSLQCCYLSGATITPDIFNPIKATLRSLTLCSDQLMAFTDWKSFIPSSFGQLECFSLGLRSTDTPVDISDWKIEGPKCFRELRISLGSLSMTFLETAKKFLAKSFQDRPFCLASPEISDSGSDEGIVNCGTSIGEDDQPRTSAGTFHVKFIAPPPFDDEVWRSYQDLKYWCSSELGIRLISEWTPSSWTYTYDLTEW
ncbi:hypothetical protein C8Q75DRAFT_138851 [Abortiporus biennis]|nr:hypothetical protein C8Q75DRAFT_138851 [Abortiporus biennis]